MARRFARTTKEELRHDSSSAASSAVGASSSQPTPALALTVPGSGRIESVTVVPASGSGLVEYQGRPGDPWIALSPGGITFDIDFDRHRTDTMPRFRGSAGPADLECHWKMEART